MKYLLLIFSVLIGFNIFIYSSILSHVSGRSTLDLYFLDVGQGDSGLVKLPGGAKVLIDGGPGKQTLSALYDVLPPTDRYIDLLILSHPQLDHFGGFIDILKRFKVGAFIWSGRDGTTVGWETLKALLKEKNIKTIILKEGDKITYKDSRLDFLMPNKKFLNAKELNDAMLVARLTSEGSKTLFSGDIGYKAMNPEGYLIKHHDIDIDILKVGHHGSKYSSSPEFLAATSPLISIVQVGEKNRYGHPTKDVIGRVADISSSLYRTDKDGTIHINVKTGLVKVIKGL